MSAASTRVLAPIGHLAGIHALRGVAALMVFVFHLHYVGKIPLPESWHLIASHGGQGVMLFYVLSAFSLFYSNRKYVQAGDSQWIFGYLTKRFFRIAPLFYVMLAAYCLLILCVFNGKLDTQRIVMNFLFIFNFAPKEAEGIVWASWSIGVEMVFYAFLPLVMVSIRTLQATVVLWFVAVLASYIFRRTLEADTGIPSGYAHFAFMSQLGVFCGGILGYQVFDKMNSSSKVMQRHMWWLAIMLGPVMIIFLLSDAAGFLEVPGQPGIQLWGLSFGFIAVLATFSSRKWVAHPVLQHLGERSYSIYLMHPVIIYFTGPLIRRLNVFCHPILGSYGFAVCALAALIPTLLASEITYRFIEVKGIELGKKFLKNRTHSVQA